MVVRPADHVLTAMIYERNAEADALAEHVGRLQGDSDATKLTRGADMAGENKVSLHVKGHTVHMNTML